MSRCEWFDVDTGTEPVTTLTCQNEAAGFYNCGVSGNMCAEHKCRCAGPPKRRQPFAAGRWIPVSERTPDDDRAVLGTAVGGKWTSCFVAFFDGTWQECSECRLVRVTHWAELHAPSPEVSP